jgi:hypothetical protein
VTRTKPDALGDTRSALRLLMAVGSTAAARQAGRCFFLAKGNPGRRALPAGRHVPVGVPGRHHEGVSDPRDRRREPGQDDPRGDGGRDRDPGSSLLASDTTLARACRVTGGRGGARGGDGGTGGAVTGVSPDCVSREGESMAAPGSGDGAAGAGDGFATGPKTEKRDWDLEVEYQIVPCRRVIRRKNGQRPRGPGQASARPSSYNIEEGEGIGSTLPGGIFPTATGRRRFACEGGNTPKRSRIKIQFRRESSSPLSLRLVVAGVAGVHTRDRRHGVRGSQWVKPACSKATLMVERVAEPRARLLPSE